MGALRTNQIRRLEETFQSFNQLSESLESTYHDLENQVAQLHLKLSDVQKIRGKEKAEREKLNERFNTILKSLPAGVVVLGPSGTVSECNPFAVELLGGPLRGENWCDVVLRAFSPKCDDGLEIYLHNGRRINLLTCPLGDEPGQIILLSDVTEIRRLQAKLDHHQRLTSMGEMVAGLAHQIRTPLSTALLIASQLKNSNLDTVKQTQLTEKVMSHMRHLENLVNDMLVFSRSEYTGEDIIYLSRLLSDLKNGMEAQCSAQNVHLIIQNCAENVILVGNKNILLSAMSNMIVNACQALNGEGKVTVITRSDQMSYIDVCVIDNGPGIPKENHEKVFEPFFTTRSQGTGLGLSIVQTIVREHKGEIWIDSSVIEGTMFVIRFPAKFASLDNKDTV